MQPEAKCHSISKIRCDEKKSTKSSEEIEDVDGDLYINDDLF